MASSLNVGICSVASDKMSQNAANGFRQMYDSQEMCDFVITSCDGIKFEVHKAYMAAVSDYFKGPTCRIPHHIQYL